MKKYLVFAYDKETKKFKRYDIYEESRIKNLPDKDLPTAIKKFNENDKNKMFLKQIFDEDVISAIVQKEEVHSILSHLQSVREDIQDVNHQIDCLESSLDSFEYKIKEELGLNKEDA